MIFGVVISDTVFTQGVGISYSTSYVSLTPVIALNPSFCGNIGPTKFLPSKSSAVFPTRTAAKQKESTISFSVVISRLSKIQDFRSRFTKEKRVSRRFPCARFGVNSSANTYDFHRLIQFVNIRERFMGG